MNAPIRPTAIRAPAVFALGVACSMALVPSAVAANPEIQQNQEAGALHAAKALAIGDGSRISAMVLFAGFPGQSAAIPTWAPKLLDPVVPGSLSHFYDDMSFGALRIDGHVGPVRYLVDRAAAAYVAENPLGQGNYGGFVADVLVQADGDIDFSQLDNDGPDGVPDSGDDDGAVDLVIIVTPHLPYGFLSGPATGIARLGLKEPHVTRDRGTGGKAITIEAGLIAQGTSFSETAGTVAHELGHLLGLPDLYNTLFLSLPEPRDPADDSAGIGRWGLMGWGALGWSGDDGPASFSAWSRLRLGWAQVQDIQQTAERALLRSVGATGHVYRVPIGASEYFLLEYRDRGGSHYDRAIPAEGVLVWHVRFDRPKWKVDLVCADGLWREAGFAKGLTADPLAGGDNLDFWAHDPIYAERHGGNLGDATDVFGNNGYDRFTSGTNPAATNDAGTRSISITAIETTAEGAWASIEVDPPRIAFGEVTVVDETDDGVLVAGEEAWLSFDPINRGGLAARGITYRLETLDSVVMTMPTEGAAPDIAVDERVFGGVMPQGGAPRLRAERSLGGSHRSGLELVAAAGDTEVGRKRLEIPVVGARQHVLSVDIEDSHGDGKIDPGDFFYLAVRLAMDDADELLPVLAFEMNSLGDGVERIGVGRVVFGDETPGVVRTRISPEFLALDEAAGSSQSFVLTAQTALESWSDTVDFGVSTGPDRTPPRVTLIRARSTGEGLRIQVADRWVLEGGGIRGVVADIYSPRDAQVLASIPLSLRDGVYEASWDGAEGRYLVAVKATDESGNRGETKLYPAVIADRASGAFDAGSEGDWASLNLPTETRYGEFAQIQVAADGSTWYAATTSRLWRSDDAGGTWHRTGLMFEGRSHLRAAIHVDAEDPLTVYVTESTHVFTGPNRIQTIGHVLASHDGGSRWARVALPDGVTSIYVDAGLPGRLYSATEGELLISEDEGTSWRRIATEGLAFNLMTHPADASATYVTVWSDLQISLFRLADSGLVFRADISGSHTAPVPDPWQQGGFYCAGDDSTVRYSADEGVSWSPLVHLDDYVNSIAVSAVEPDLLYVSDTSRLWRSRNGGSSWEKIRGYDHSLVRVVPALPSVLLVSIGYGRELRVSHDYGETSKTLGVDEEAAPAGALWFDAAARLNVASLRHDDEGWAVRGIQRLGAGGLDWSWMGSTSSNSMLAAPFDVVLQDPHAEEVLLAHPGGSASVYERSLDGGQTWTPATERVWGDGSGVWAPPTIVGDPLRPGTYYLGDEFIRRSDDQGATWERIGPLRDVVLPNTRAGGLLLGPDPGQLTTAYRDSVWQSWDDGVTWSVTGRVEPGAIALDLTRHRRRSDRLLALTLRGCYASDDGGDHWRKVMSPVSGAWMSAHFREDPEDVDVLYIVSNREVHRTKDAGVTWASLGDQLPGMPWIHDLAVDPMDRTAVYVAITEGVYRLGPDAYPTSVLAQAPTPCDPLLQQNYPNPFNASTVIRFFTPVAGRASVTVYNLLGQEVRKLVDEHLEAGHHATRWDGRNDAGQHVSSGVYLYRLQTGQSAMTRKLVLIK